MKNSLCVSWCGSGYYGDDESGKCEKCDASCKTCIDGAKKCTSCYPPLYIKGEVAMNFNELQ